MKRRGWLIAAVVFLVAATLLMMYAEEPQPEPEAVAEVTFPRQFDRKHSARMKERATLPAHKPVETDAGTRISQARDPVLAAISSGAKSAVIVEANALRNSPIGELLIECLATRGRRNPLEELRNRAGVDVLQDLDRVAMTEHGVVMSGHFEKAKWNELLGSRATPKKYGEKGTLYTMAGADGGTPDGVFVSWGDGMAMVADNEAEAQAAIDRLEGRAPSVPLITEEQSYGEIYGVLSADDLARLLPPAQAEIAGRIKEAAERVELHVDASHDVGVVANVQGPDPKMVEDLGKSMGGLLAGARMQTQLEGASELTEFLDLAKVRQRNGSFGLELGLPLELLQKRLAFCKDENRRQNPPSDANRQHEL